MVDQGCNYTEILLGGGGGGGGIDDHVAVGCMCPLPRRVQKKILLIFGGLIVG